MLRRVLASASIAFALSLFAATVAEAAAPRTFVASNGNDANPCSIVSPCRTFAAAIAQTISGGEVIVLDSAGYGPVTITQSISIIAPAGIYAGISVPPGQDGVRINAAGGRVRLEGLTINGAPGSGFGIRFGSGTLLQVTRCHITNMGDTGIELDATGATVEVTNSSSRNNIGRGLNSNVSLNVESSTFANNGQWGVIIGGDANLRGVTVTGNGNVGIHVFASPGGLSRVSIDGALVSGNLLGGVIVEAFGDYSFASLEISRSMVTRNSLSGITAKSAGGVAQAYLTATANDVSENDSNGIEASGLNATAVVTGNTITKNGAAGIAGSNGGTVLTGQDNTLTGNTLDVGPSVSPFTKG